MTGPTTGNTAGNTSDDTAGIPAGVSAVTLGGGRRSPSPRAILWVVGFSVFVAADDLTVVSTMLRPIIGDLGLVLPDGLDDAAWVVNAYLIAFIAVMPVAGRISDVIGRRRTFVLAYLVFLVGTIWIPLATSLGPFLVGRVLTAIGGGAMVPVALAVVGDVYPERARARALGTLGAIETLGWVWGPLYGAMLVRFLTWRWQFWLNVPLAIVGLVAVWWALAEHDRPDRESRIDWFGAGLLTVALVSLNLALLGSAEVQSVTGFDELRGGSGFDLRTLYPVALAAGAGFVWRQRRSAHPLVARDLLAGRNVRTALIVNFVVGAALVIAMVDVPLFVNAVEVDLERSAVIAGWILSALTAAMAIASYVGGRITERTWYGPPVILGLAAATVAYGLMGWTWTGDTPYPVLALQLALLGAGIGLTVAPTTSAVVDHAPPDSRGAAAAVVMVVRLLGLSVGLSALTAWGLARFNRLRGGIELPPLTDPGFEAALRRASADLTSQSIAETFVATAVVVAFGLALSVALLRRRSVSQEVLMSTHDDIQPGDPSPPRPAAPPPPDGSSAAEAVTSDGTPDADGAVDAGAVDAGVVDAGVVDAGVVDAGVVDAGADAVVAAADDAPAVDVAAHDAAAHDGVADAVVAAADARVVDVGSDVVVGADAGAAGAAGHDGVAAAAHGADAAAAGIAAGAVAVDAAVAPGDDLGGDDAAQTDGGADPGPGPGLDDDDARLVDTDKMPVFKAAPRPEPPPPAAVTEPGALPPAASWAGRHLAELLIGFGVVLLAAFGLILLLFVRLQAAENDLAATRDDMQRVEAGAALFASQVTGFQEQLGELSPTISAGLDEAVAGLETFSTSTLEFTVNIDEEVAIDTDFQLERTITVPINTSIPINESFDTTITIAGPFGIDIPLDVTVPIDIDVPIDLEVDIPVDETVPISVSVPVKLDVPIAVDVADTELAALSESLALGLQSFTEIIEGLGG